MISCMELHKPNGPHNCKIRHFIKQGCCKGTHKPIPKSQALDCFTTFTYLCWLSAKASYTESYTMDMVLDCSIMFVGMSVTHVEETHPKWQQKWHTGRKLQYESPQHWLQDMKSPTIRLNMGNRAASWLVYIVLPQMMNWCSSIFNHPSMKHWKYQSY